jgi:thioredoxin 1
MSDFNEIINSDKPTLVDFYTNWCGPCKMMNPIIDDVKNKLGDEAKVLKVDVDNNRDAAIKYGVRGVPTLIIFKNGEPVWRQSGVLSSDVLVQKIKEFI